MGEITCYVKGPEVHYAFRYLERVLRFSKILPCVFLKNLHSDTDSCGDREALLFYALHVNWESGKNQEDKGLEFFWSFMEWSQRNMIVLESQGIITPVCFLARQSK